MSERALIVLGAVGLPALALGLHHDTGHLGDIEFFHEWYLAFREGAGFYRDGPGLNYPILGVLLVCLPAWLVEGSAALELPQYALVLKTTLALSECALILALASLLRRVGVRARWALAIYLCPSTWAPGAWFGQIDVCTSLALVIAFIGVLDYRREPEPESLALALGGTWCALLIKQLAWFTLPALAIGIALGLRRAPRSHLAAALASALVLVAADPFVELPAGWHSHLLWVWFGGGSSHADFIVAGGASMWSLVADVNVSAHAWRVGLSAHQWGLLLFALAQVPLWIALRHDGDLLRYGALCNLLMCVVLTGVHERYFVHGSLLLLVAGFAQPRWKRVSGWVVCAWWGLYVLASLHFDAFSGWPFRSHVPTALLLVALAIVHLAPSSMPGVSPRSAEA